MAKVIMCVCGGQFRRHGRFKLVFHHIEIIGQLQLHLIGRPIQTLQQFAIRKSGQAAVCETIRIKA